jgi:hypothetical protein
MARDDPAVRHYRHPTAGFELDLPAGAEMALDLPPVVTVPGGGGEFGANCVIAAEPARDETVLDEWVGAAWMAQESALDAFRPLDRGDARLGGRAGEHTLAHHVVGPHAVTLEQWWLLAEGRRWVLSASCATLDYDALADPFAALATSFAPAA